MPAYDCPEIFVDALIHLCQLIAHLDIMCREKINYIIYLYKSWITEMV